MEGTGMLEEIRTAGVEEARAKLPTILRAANRDGVVTVVTKHGVPYAAVVPISKAAVESPKLTDLRGSARGCYGDAASFVDRLRDEW